jgi:hypothetical protein
LKKRYFKLEAVLIILIFVSIGIYIIKTTNIMRATEFTNEAHPTDINFDKAYNAFNSAEMSGVDAGNDGSGHYIRTHGANKKTNPEAYKKGSSAYGPTQLNKTTAKDFTTRYPNAFKGQEKYAKKFIGQGSQFNKFGRESEKPGYDKKYEYGGKGDLSAPEYHDPYKKLNKTIMRQMNHELRNKNSQAGIKDLVQRWRGKSASEDPRYYKEFFNRYDQQKAIADIDD